MRMADWVGSGEARRSQRIADKRKTSGSSSATEEKKRPRKTTTLHIPLDILSVITSYVCDAYTLSSIAMSCKTGLQIVRALPRSYSLLLDESDVLERHPVDVCRAISIMAFERCEVCVDQGFNDSDALSVDATFGIYAHWYCLHSHLTNAPNGLVKDFLTRFGAPASHVRNHGHDSRYIRKRLPGIVPDYWTVEGVESLLRTNQLTETNVAKILADVAAHQQENARIVQRAQILQERKANAWPNSTRIWPRRTSLLSPRSSS